MIDKFAERGLRSLAVARQVYTCRLMILLLLLTKWMTYYLFFFFFSYAICLQVVPEKTKESAGGPWELVGLLPLFDPPRHDSAETIRRALHLGVNVKMITGNILLP